MKAYIIVITSLLLSSGPALAQNSVYLSEQIIKTMIDKKPPNVQQIEASFLDIKRQHLTQDEQFGFRLDGQGEVFKSKERLLNNFDGGVVINSSTYSLGLVKPTHYGVEVGAKVFGNKVTNAFVSDATTTGASISLALDLFQDFLGRRSNNNYKKTALSVKRADLERKTQLKNFEGNARKIYWALVANSEQKKLLKSLVQLSEKQYKQSRSRNRSGVADSGEVARYRSQWTLRKANMLSLEYQRSTLLKSLKELFPSLNGKNILLSNYNIDDITQKVLMCAHTIGSYPKSPSQFTYYDEIVELLKQEEKLENKMISAHDDPQVKLVGEYSSVGRDLQGYQAAYDNLSDDPRGRQRLSLQVSIPLGSRKADSREVMEQLAKKRYQAQAQDYAGRVEAFHIETKNTVELLRKVVQNQRDTNKSLARSLKLSNKKFRQARISLQELISEQDTHLQSRLNEIDTNLTIINVFMDYFSIYPETPCEFNRI